MTWNPHSVAKFITARLPKAKQKIDTWVFRFAVYRVRVGQYDGWVKFEFNDNSVVYEKQF